MSSPFLICEFAKTTLSNLVKESFGSDFPDINTKKQINYLFNYLKDLSAKTILLESDYIDKDYLEDHSRYYVKCFTTYGERCARLHFFSHEFDHPTFAKIFNHSLGTKNEEAENVVKALQDNYLGFIVIKPLPKTFIGKTCLKLYDSFNQSEQRQIISRTYRANLFGVDLTIDTVAFQEQDKVISACATTAVWTSLQALDKSDSRNPPSSSEITLAAINHIENSSNCFPNEGLTNKQILRALDIYGFRNHHIDLTQIDNQSFPRIIRIIKSYIDSGLPVILGVNVFSIAEDEQQPKQLDSIAEDEQQPEQLDYIADHAVTVLGYKENNQGTVIYLHDDRLGPFARAKITTVKKLLPDTYTNDSIESSSCIYLQEKDEDSQWLDPKQILMPDSLIIPNHRKVRISVELIDNTCLSIVDEFNEYYKKITNNGSKASLPKLTYEIKLENVSQLKSRILKSLLLQNKAEFLTKSAAKFLWSAKFFLNDELSLEVLFDSTDIPQGNAVTHLLKYNDKNCHAILTIFEQLIESKMLLPESIKDNFLSAFMRALKPKEPNAFTYLDEQYGEPRAPKRLKPEEITNSQLQTQNNIEKRYGREDRSLNEAYPNQKADDTFLIWAISLDGALLIGEELEGKGHPTLTGFKPARIAGELRKVSDTDWSINAKSGRYSSQYHNTDDLLISAREKFLEVFNLHKENHLTIQKKDEAD